MKRTLLALVAFIGMALSVRASLVYSNSFGYPDGALDAVSAGSPLGQWFLHSGTTNQMQVSGGQVIVKQQNSEDTSAYITNALFPTPFTSGNLYASFTVNFYETPTQPGGAYFFHFKDTGISNFRARVFAITNNAAPGAFRVGITAAGTTPFVIPTDLVLSNTYKLVVRYNLDQPTNATIWINPNSESSPVNRADATDTTTAVPISMVALRETSAASGMGSMFFDNLVIGNAFSDVAVVGGNPTIGGIPDQKFSANTNSGPVAFFVSDVETPANSLVLSGSSSNPTLVPNNPANITFGGTGNSRTVTITSAANQQGTATITLVVTDSDNLKATNSFLVTVGAPSISTVPDQTIITNTPSGSVAFTVFDAETPNGLTVTASSSNPTLIQNSDVVISGTGTNRSLVINPEAGQAGFAVITLTVSDGTLSASTTFNVTVSPLLGLLLGDSFTYPDGTLVTSSGGFWARHSGTNDDVFVVSNKVALSATNNDDVHAFFTNSFDAAVGSGVILYSKFTVNFSVLPSLNGGGYFAHFKDLGTSNFRARVFAETNGAAPGKFRIGIANGGFTVAAYPQDLSLGTTYTVVTRYNVGTGVSTLWINPNYESSQSVTATDAPAPVDIWAYSFRQDGPTGGGIGSLVVDDLLVGTAFTDVIPFVAPPPSIPLNISLLNNQVVLSWTNAAFSLQAAPTITSTFTNVPSATSPYTNSAAASQNYFRLKF